MYDEHVIATSAPHQCLSQHVLLVPLLSAPCTHLHFQQHGGPHTHLYPSSMEDLTPTSIPVSIVECGCVWESLLVVLAGKELPYTCQQLHIHR